MSIPSKALCASYRSRLDAAFQRADSLPKDDLEILSDYARYLCILTSGFVETMVTELALDHCRTCSSQRVSNYVESQLKRLQNVNTERLCQFVGAFDPVWRDELEAFLEGERKDALDSVVNLRNKIAHGESVGLTLARIGEYRVRIVEIVDHVEGRFG